MKKAALQPVAQGEMLSGGRIIYSLNNILNLGELGRKKAHPAGALAYHKSL